MHICPDEVAPMISVLEFIPYIMRVVWYKAAWLFQ